MWLLVQNLHDQTSQISSMDKLGTHESVAEQLLAAVTVTAERLIFPQDVVGFPFSSGLNRVSSK